MINKKFILISVFIIILLVLLNSLFNRRSDKDVKTEAETPDTSSTVSFPDQDTSRTDGNGIQETGREDSTVFDSDKQEYEEKIIETEKIKERIDEHTVRTTSRGDILFADTEEFQLLYFAKEDEYLISILSNPFDEIRPVAEEAFLSALQINKATACALKVYVSSPVWINPNQSGQIFPLSFCKQ
jgi:hypothetical protein